MAQAHTASTEGGPNTVATKPTKKLSRFAVVWARLLFHLERHPEDLPFFENQLDNIFNEFQSMDGFGTEAASDPRGDFRDGEWSMRRVQGIDK